MQMKKFIFLLFLLCPRLLMAAPVASELLGTPNSDGFGWVTAISGKYALVAAPFADSHLSKTGAVFVYREASANNWVADGQLLTTDIYTDDQFGHSMAIDGDIAVIGSPFHNLNQGAVYIFSRDILTGIWSQIQKLTPPNTIGNPQFGKSVTIDGDTLLVSAWKAKNTAWNVGEVYLYHKDPTTGQWGYQQTLTPVDATKSQRFGSSTSIKGNVAVIGSFFNTVDGYSKAGSAYVFEKSSYSQTWVQTSKLVAQDRYSNNYFGGSVDTNGQDIIVGAHKNSAAAIQGGSVYVYSKTHTGLWNQQAQLTASDAKFNDGFGRAITITGNTIYSGASRANYNGLNNAGAVYRFDFNPASNQWDETSKIAPTTATTGDFIGGSLDADGKRLIIGAGFGRTTPKSVGQTFIYTSKGLNRLSYSKKQALGTLSNVEQSHATIATLESGISMAVWGGNNGIWYQLFDANGIPLNTEQKIKGTTKKDFYPDVETSGQSNFIIAWQGATSRGYEPFLTIIDKKGVPQVTPFAITQNLNYAFSPTNTYGILEKIHPDIASLPSGDFLITWDSLESGVRHVYLQHFSQWGLALSPTLQLDNNAGQPITNILGSGIPDIDANIHGDVIVAWGGELDAFNNMGIVYRRFNINDANWLFSPQKWLVQSLQNNNTSAARVMVSINKVGNIAATWQQKRLLPYSLEAYFKTYNARTNSWSSPTQLQNQLGTAYSTNAGPVPYLFDSNRCLLVWSSFVPNGGRSYILGQFHNMLVPSNSPAFIISQSLDVRRLRPALSLSSHQKNMSQINITSETRNITNQNRLFIQQLYIAK